MLDVVVLPVLYDNYVFIIYDVMTKDAVVIDPAEAQPVLDEVEKRGLSIKSILNTHHHQDHVGGNRQIKSQTGATIIGNRHDAARIPGIDQEIEPGLDINVLGFSVHVIDIPGHTIGHIAYHFPNQNWLFCGDTVFAMGCGRLFEGTAEQMVTSIDRLMRLPDDTLIYCAHEYTLTNGEFAQSLYPNNSDIAARIVIERDKRYQSVPTIPTVLGLEKTTNPFVMAESVEEFAEIRKKKDQF